MKPLFKFLLAITLVAGPVLSFAASINVLVNKVEDRHLSGFHAVSLAGSFDVYITQGSTESVKVEAPDDVIDRIVTEVDGGVLNIHSKHDNWNWGNWFSGHKKIAIYVTAKDLNSISLSGSGDIFFKDGITANSLKLRVTGSGDMSGKVSVKSLDSSIAGSGDMKLSGRADNSVVGIVGSGNFEARSLETVSTTVHVAGSGDATVNASDKVNASVSGSGDVRYTGSAKNISSSKAGSGDISRL